MSNKNQSDSIYAVCFSNYGSESFYGRISSATNIFLDMTAKETFSHFITYSSLKDRSEVMLFCDDETRQDVLLLYRKMEDTSLWDERFSVLRFDDVASVREYCTRLPDNILPVYCIVRSLDSFRADLLHLLEEDALSVVWEIKTKKAMLASSELSKNERNSIKIFNLFKLEEIESI